jgi:hypothetical protein
MRRHRREDVSVTAVVALVVVGVGLLGSMILIQKEFEPRGGLLGAPGRMPACGRDYIAGDTALTLDQIEQGLPPGLAPVVFEPLIGEIPLTAPFEAHRCHQGCRSAIR